MIHHTEAFKRLKDEQQKILDFSVLICYSIPNLKKSIKGYKNKVKNYETFVKPDYFPVITDIDRLEPLTMDYKGNLSKYILLSAFSFFESYFRDVVEELIEFHGGKESFINTLHTRHKQILHSQSTDIVKNKKKLNEPLKKKNWKRYKKYIDLLEKEASYRHPSELLATYGLKYFIETVTGNNFKSVMIPDALEFAFGLDLTDKKNQHADLKGKDLKETFEIMRNLRNAIGHGNAGALGFEKVMDLIRFTRFFSVKIDSHLVNNFFILERSK
ncbi:hypothetical protein CMU40_09845 [Elizabethkingia anophelis]|uniref:HEPN domain-containing protein n=1 Tax=Elizabethkingia anophelis TaxID=1117645 RepID=UPI0021A4D4D3|nr:hypothetical protein [Elizabethkingia anophelis]MCT3828445.1 hypothetical protein [Elizabethkingia anophelis]MCT3839348.1 hypothetical protein [Elizabethkingia anophelis]MCT3842993.1 hypothetical protein [Elizabethkingia anophelis]MCT3850157.1 hypothetical protein [Elizabethkingia anophelis]